MAVSQRLRRPHRQLHRRVLGSHGNDISGNHGAGIYIYGSGTVGNLVAANTITDSTAAIGETLRQHAGAPTGNAIGGTAAAYANIITNNGGNGIYISGSGTTGNLAAGNFIGTDASDDIGLGNSLSGVRIDKGASGNTISDNVIAASGLDGVTIDGDGTSGNLVEGNDVGTNASGSVVAGLGNSDSGVAIFGGRLEHARGRHDRRERHQHQRILRRHRHHRRRDIVQRGRGQLDHRQHVRRRGCLRRRHREHDRRDYRR